MKTRVITAVIGFLIAILAITVGGYLYDAVIVVLTALGWGELARMFKKRHIRIPVMGGHVVLLCLLIAFSLSFYAWGSILFALGLMAMFVHYTFTDSEYNFGDLTSTILGLVYLGTGMASLLIIRQNAFMGAMHMPWSLENWGVILVWLMLFSTWASDTFAYFAGCFFGKRKIVPTISPNKTLEGFIGGFIGCLITGLVFAWLVGIPWTIGLAEGVIAGILAPLGDLFESKLKRNCEVKDSGVLLPGHGGVLDRFDSLLFVAPITVLFFALL